MDAQTSANQQIVRRIYDAFNARDVPLLASLFADDFETPDMGTQAAAFVLPDDELQASNRAVEILFTEFFRLCDGKVVEFRAYWDSGALLRQIR